MKAVTAALVLIAGAAVVLWYGNTLNSWVLGGLIGGLAALLLSIPISLTLFSYLSRRHDERVRAEEQEEMSLAQEAYEYRYPRVPSRVMKRAYEVESYVLTNEDAEEMRQEESAHRVQRALPAPSQQPQPSMNQSQASKSSEKLPVPRGAYLPVPQSQQQAKPRVKQTTRLRSTTRKMSYPGFPGYEPGSSLSQHRSEALRAARLEAAKQKQLDDVEVFPTHSPKRGVSVRTSQPLVEQDSHRTPQRASRSLPSQTANHQRRRIVDASPSQQGTRRTLPAEGESTGSPHRADPQTEYLSNQFQRSSQQAGQQATPQTAPLRRTPQTGQIARQVQDGGQRSGSEATTENLNRPLVRRAPYMYEDDPLRQKLAQQLDTPAVRRSSRYESLDEEDDNDLM